MKSTCISRDGISTKEWDGTSDTNGDGQLSFKEDAWTTSSIGRSGVTVYENNYSGNVITSFTTRNACYIPNKP